jgi:hypothetical protein
MLEMREGHLYFILSQYWKYIICNPILSLIEYSFQKKPDEDHTPHWGQIREDKSEREGLEQKSNI